MKTIEKRYFEDLFKMNSGYVLDFTNDTFAQLFRETIQVNIYDDKYSFNGDSKAKRLRTFWEIEPDDRVGKVLSEMLDIWKYQNSVQGTLEDHKTYNECQKIVGRMLGKLNCAPEAGAFFGVN